MKCIFIFGLAIIIYGFLLVVLDFIMGMGIQDQWDNLMKWVRKNKSYIKQ